MLLVCITSSLYLYVSYNMVTKCDEALPCKTLGSLSYCGIQLY